MHVVTMAVWGVASNVVAGSAFTIFAGVKCLSGQCSLEGARVEARDGKGAIVGEGTLSAGPLEGTSALHWCQLTLQGPGKPGSYEWLLVFPGQGDHGTDKLPFGFTAVRQPECKVSVEAVIRDMDYPIEGITVLLNRYQAIAPRNSNVVTLEVPLGSYNLIVGKDGWTTYDSFIDVEGDTTVKVELSPGPVRSGIDVSAANLGAEIPDMPPGEEEKEPA